MTPNANLAGRSLSRVTGLRRLTVLVALAFSVTAVGLLAIPTAAVAWNAGAYDSSSESQLITLQNQARASAGLSSLKLDTALRTIARWRSKDMVDRNYFSHTILGTTRNVFWYMTNTYGYCYKSAGENIGTVTWPGATVAEATNWVFQKFMASPGHRDNILGKAWDVVAVGAYKGAGDEFMWTVLFADKCGSTTQAATPTPEADAQADPEADAQADPEADAQADPQAHGSGHASPHPTPTPTPTPTPSPTPTVAPLATTNPALEPTATSFDPGLSTTDPTLEPTVAPTPVVAPSAVTLPPGGFRVIDPPTEPGLVDSILDRVSARYFGG